MKRAIGCMGIVLLSVACEDGPGQPYQPSPNGAATAWNDGNTKGTTDPATQGFGVDTSGGTKQEICPGPKKKAVWADLLKQPIKPPRMAANLDMAGDDTWKGITLEEAEQINCQSIATTDAGYNYWGDNGEVTVQYRLSNRKIVYLGLDQGYTGKLEFKSRDGAHRYSIQISSQISKDGAPYVISWDANPATGVGVWANEMTDALFATFAPGLPAETNCRASGHCVIGNFGDQGYLFIPALGSAFRVANINAPQPTPSTVSYMDQYLEKVLPFSQAYSLMKLDAAGPQGYAFNLGPSNKTCNLHMGMSFQDLTDNCVKVTGNAASDTAEYNKLLGGLSHSTERFQFDLSGVDVNFTDKTLAADSIVRDSDRPTPDDDATEFHVDQATLGPIANDYTANSPTQPKDIHGTGLVYLEYARLVQDALNTYLPANKRHALGDPACLGDTPADGCTGFEGFVAPIAPARVQDAQLKRIAVAYPAVPTRPMASGLKPGHQKVVFCNVAAAAVNAGNYGTACESGDTFPTSFARVLRVFGKGKVANMPPEVGDSRFFFRQWATAVFKYFLVETAAGTSTANDVKAAPFDPNDVFFDSLGSGQFEIAEYVDRRFASATQDVTDLQITADIRNGIMSSFEFSRDIFRGETALYTAAREHATSAVGAEKTALLTNLFGSPVLSAGWSDTAQATAYECAAGLKTIADCEGQLPAVDDNGAPEVDELGRPILQFYPGAFSATGTVFRLGATPITIKKVYPTIQQAMFTMPVLSDPYDTTSAPVNAASPTADFLVPWLPKQPGVGFAIPINGTRDRFVNTYSLDLSGTTITANVDYDLADPTDPTKGIKLLAVETTDFLGDVFLCQDPTTGNLLRARMYSPVAKILDWINTHPAATAACGLLVRYSPYNNFPDYISSVSNGVTLGVTQGGGFGRVVDVTLFQPGQ